jgi:hypothetical protein
MWDGVTYVEPSHDPVIHEGYEQATLVIHNAGPANVRIRAWLGPPPQTKPSGIDIELRVGNTKSINGTLIRAATERADSLSIASTSAAKFSTLAWRIVK